MKKIWEKDEFIAEYTKWKAEGLTESAIAAKMFIGKNTLYRNKKDYGLPILKPSERALNNTHGLTRSMLEKAKKIGLDSHLICQRIRDYHWTLEDAISIPAIPKDQCRSWHIKVKGLFQDELY
jgi:hypothetical protein